MCSSDLGVPTRPIPPSDPSEIAERLRLSATRLARQLRQQSDTGLTPSQLSALAAISNHGPLTLGELADRERVAPPSITRVAGNLEAAGLVSKQSDAVDRRVCRVETTPAGEKLLAEIRKRKNLWLAARLREVSPEDQALLAAALDVLDELTTEQLSHQERP